MYQIRHYCIYSSLPFTAEDVVVNDVTLTSAVVSWIIPSFIVQEQYYVLYGTDPDNLDQVSETITGLEDTTLINSSYSISLEGLNEGTLYYVQVAAVYDEVFARYSEVIPFITKEPGRSLCLNTQSAVFSHIIALIFIQNSLHQSRTNILSPISISWKHKYNARILR